MMLVIVSSCPQHSLVFQVESLAWDIDYRSKVSRTQFEDACKDLTLRYAKPIFDALSNAGLTLVRQLISAAYMHIFCRTHRTVG